MEPQALEYSERHLHHYDQEVSRRETRKNKKKLFWTIFSTCLMVGVWSGIMYMGYLQANTYMTEMKEDFNAEIKNIQIHNQKELDGLKVEMEKIQDEMELIKHELASTGKAVDGTDQTGQALQEQITSLNKQLSELKTSLNKLEDAASAW